MAHKSKRLGPILRKRSWCALHTCMAGTGGGRSAQSAFIARQQQVVVECRYCVTGGVTWRSPVYSSDLPRVRITPTQLPKQHSHLGSSVATGAKNTNRALAADQARLF